MMNRVAKILCIVGLIVFWGCRKDRPYKPVELCRNLTTRFDSVPMFTKGNWKWIESSRWGFYGSTTYDYPKKAGYFEEVRFSGDTIMFIHNMLEVRLKRFKIARESEFTNYPPDSATILATYNFETNQREIYYRIGICEDYMVFFQAYASDVSPDMIYERIR